MDVSSSQNKGLNDWAKSFVQNDHIILGTRYTTDILIGGGHIDQTPKPIIKPGPEKKVSNRQHHGTCQSFPSYYYVLPDGRKYWEFVQLIILRPDSHPCFKGVLFRPRIEYLFLALLDENGNQIEASLWSDSEIESAVK